MVNFTSADLDRIAQAVGDAESKSSGEIRVVMASTTTRAERAITVALSGAAAVAGALWVWLEAWRHPEPFFMILGAVGPALVVFAICELTVRSPERRARKVEARAKLEFARQGVGDTKDKTGVLILLSLGDRRVHLLADEGINAKVPPSMWSDEVARIVEGLRGKRATETLCEVISDIGAELARHFPRASDDKNELPDRPVMS